MENKFCTYMYKRGKREGYFCMAKIEINSKDWKCSRHCKDYETKSRSYTNRDRCEYIRQNGIRCKHYSMKYMKYCYIHGDENKNKNIEKKLFLKKLEKKRKNYFLNKKKRKQNLYTQIFIDTYLNKNKIKENFNEKILYKYFNKFNKEITKVNSITGIT